MIKQSFVRNMKLNKFAIPIVHRSVCLLYRIYLSPSLLAKLIYSSLESSIRSIREDIYIYISLWEKKSWKTKAGNEEG